MKKRNRARTIDEIKDYLAAVNNISPEEFRTLKNDQRKGVQRLLFSFLQKRERFEEEVERLHKIRLKEQSLQRSGYSLIAGVDEAGRGPLAGPVVAASVILKHDEKHSWHGINDSKQLSPQAREELYKQIVANAEAFAVGVVNVEVIDRINIHHASLEAMKLAVLQLWPQPDFVISDGFAVPDLNMPQEAVKGGDARCLSIAAASIIAKVTRDKIMLTYDKFYPGYGFARHKGYSTPEHKAAIKRLGLSPIHRRSFQWDK